MCWVGCLDISSPHPKTTLTASRRMRGSVQPRGCEGEGVVQDRRHHPSGSSRDTGMEQPQKYQERKRRKRIIFLSQFGLKNDFYIPQVAETQQCGCPGGKHSCEHSSWRGSLRAELPFSSHLSRSPVLLSHGPWL